LSSDLGDLMLAEVLILVGDENSSKSPTLSYYSCLSLRSSSLSSVELSSTVGSEAGLKFLLFQSVLTKPLAFSKLVAVV
jgi:hypothetical protein